MKIYKITADKERLRSELERIGVDDYALSMDRKGLCLNFSVADIKPAAANVIKQEAIASGMDAGVKRGSVSCSIDKTDVLLMGAPHLYERLIKRLKRQPFGLEALACELEKFIKPNREDKIFSARGLKISLDTPKVIGIFNASPDSFSDGGLFIDSDDAEKRIDEMIAQGADILDIGGMSSRPGSDGVSSSEEIKRIEKVLCYALDKGAVVSIDTWNFETAGFALEKGAHIVNDISGLQSPEMRAVCSEYKAGVCIMHMKGNPKNMQDDVSYGNLLKDIKDFFHKALEASASAGIERDSVIIDPGFGFGKNADQNYTLLKYLSEFKGFGLPILAGLSRKSMIGAATGKAVDERLAGTIALNAAAILNGASFIRVHDVKEGVETVKIIDYLKKAKEE